MVLLASLWTAYLESRQVGIIDTPSNYNYNFLQRRVYRNTSTVPSELVDVFKQDTFDKSRHYQLDKSLYSSLHSLYKIVEFLVIINNLL